MKITSDAYLLKIGKRNHIESLLNQGLVYMNTINYFKEVETDEERRDEHEGINRIEQVTWIKIQSKDGKEFEFRGDSDRMRLASAQLRVSNPEVKGNIFSMMAITPEVVTKTNRFDERNTQFGDHFLFIFDYNTFFERLSSTLNDMGLKHWMGFVHYYDEKSYNGDLSPFHKPNRFKHQHEFRVLVEYEKGEPLSFEIGNLTDISILFPIEKFTGLRFYLREKGVEDYPTDADR